MSETGQRKTSGTQIALYVPILFITLVIVVFGVMIMSMKQGRDAQVFCSAAHVSTVGKNPYAVTDLELGLSWNYQPYLLALFRAVCPPPIDFPFLLSSIAIALIVALFSFWPYSVFNLMDFAKEHFTEFFCMGLLGITLVLPRLKPYSFLSIIPPLFYLIRLQGKGRQNLVLAISTFFPIICFFLRIFLTGEHAIFMLLLTYSPTISLLATFAMMFYFVAHPRQTVHA